MKAKDKSKRLHGTVKLITIKEEDLKEGNDYIYYTLLSIKIVKLLAILEHEYVQIVDNKSNSSIEAISILKTLVVVPLHEVATNSIPIKQSQWKYAINEIGKEVEFVIQDKFPTKEEWNKLPDDGKSYLKSYKQAKIISSKVNKAQERYEKAIKEFNEILDYIEDENPLEVISRNIVNILKIAAGIEE